MGYRGDPQAVEHLRAVLPGIGVAVLADALVVEAIDTGDLSGLVVATQQGHVGLVLHLQAHEQLEGLDGIEPSVHVIALPVLVRPLYHEHVVRPRQLSPGFKQLEEIVELAMDIAADCDRSLNWLNICLFKEDLLDLQDDVERPYAVAEKAKILLRDALALFHRR